MVKCYSGNLLLKHDLSLISWQEVRTHPKVSSHGLKLKSCSLLIGGKKGRKLGKIYF